MPCGKFGSRECGAIFSLLNKEKRSISGDISGDINIILTLLRAQMNITAKEISEQTDFSVRKISCIMKELRETGVIIRVGSK